MIIPNCPFCGGIAKLSSSKSTDTAYIICLSCEASSGFKDQPEQAIAAWSIRVTDSKKPPKLTLSPCAHCGEAAEIKSEYPYSDRARYYAFCTNVKCCIRSPYFFDENDLIEAWNRRF